MTGRLEKIYVQLVVCCSALKRADWHVDEAEWRRIVSHVERWWHESLPVAARTRGSLGNISMRPLVMPPQVGKVVPGRIVLRRRGLAIAAAAIYTVVGDDARGVMRDEDDLEMFLQEVAVFKDAMAANSYGRSVLSM